MDFQHDKIKNNKTKNIYLGGFPPIFYIDQEYKQIKEFSKLKENKNLNNINKLNILNIKSILNIKK